MVGTLYRKLNKCIMGGFFSTKYALRNHYFVNLFDQVSQYTFTMCSFREKKSEPTEFMALDSFTVDYTDPLDGKFITSCTSLIHSFSVNYSVPLDGKLITSLIDSFSVHYTVPPER